MRQVNYYSKERMDFAEWLREARKANGYRAEDVLRAFQKAGIKMDTCSAIYKMEQGVYYPGFAECVVLTKLYKVNIMERASLLFPLV